MSRDDLLADLQTEVSARPVVPPTPPPAPRVDRGTGPATPALDLSWTPLRWSLPSVGGARHGVGVSLRFGPVAVTLAVR
ncbi:MAG: hypothetical protein JWN88_1801 [Frankiales bacterium]|jgi:hypothetical protein|nr:hypothetical protein [Frankiales bacterium]